MESEQARKKIFLMMGAVVAFILTIVVVALVNILPKLGKVEVYIGYAPFIAEVTLNGEKIKNNSKMYLEEGEYVINVSYDGFKPVEREFTVYDGMESIYGSLIAETEEAVKIAEDHIEDYYKIDGYFGADSVDEGEEEEKTWPIIAKLPIINSLYGIGYIIDSDNNITLTVSASAAYMDIAVGKMIGVAEGVDDLAKYKIEFKEFKNALEGVFVANSETDPESFIRKGFASVANFSIVAGEVSNDYYCAYVSSGLKSDYTLVHYRLVAQRSGDGWRLVSQPSPIATIYNTPDVPMSVLDLVNAL